MKKKEAYEIFFRYLIILISGIFISVFYYIFAPITIGAVYLILKIIYPSALLSGNMIVLGSHSISLIRACIAGAAYYLLFILAMSVPLDYLKRIKSIIFLFFSFLAINVIRIAIFAILFVGNFQQLSFAHLLFWYAGSTILIICLWFVNTKIFRLKAIPFITDIKKMSSQIQKIRNLNPKILNKQ